MNFDFSDDQKQLAQDLRRLFADHGGPTALRPLIEGAKKGGPFAQNQFDEALWNKLADLGWLGLEIGEDHGGTGLSIFDLCQLAQEAGRAIAAVPLSSTLYGLVGALMGAENPDLLTQLGPKIAAGETIGALAISEGLNDGRPKKNAHPISVSFENGQLHGEKYPVIDGVCANLFVVLAQSPEGPIAVLAEKNDKVKIEALAGLDHSRNLAKVSFSGTPAAPLCAAGEGRTFIQSLYNRMAVLLAFEQLGGAMACLEMATAYAKQRLVFARPIGSFQAIKHKLADIYVAIEVARAHCYYAAWALENKASNLELASASARIAASKAFSLAAKENIQTHGGIGFTWEMDPGLFHRRAQFLAAQIGGPAQYKNSLIGALKNGQRLNTEPTKI